MLDDLLGKAFDLFFPPDDDTRTARTLSPATLSRLLDPSAHPEAGWVTSLFPYRDERIRALIRSVKYRGETRILPIVGKMMAEEMMTLISEKQALDGWQVPFLVPVPSSKGRLRERGYNQALRIADATALHLNEWARVAPQVLIREERPSQVRMPKNERMKNIHGAFHVPHGSPVQGIPVILIDDVVETAATLTDARRALMEAGAREVFAFALAR